MFRNTDKHQFLIEGMRINKHEAYRNMKVCLSERYREGIVETERKIASMKA